MVRFLRRILLGGTLLVLLNSSAWAVRIGAPAPDFTLPDLTGHKITLSSLRGKVVLLNFWSTTCGPCVAEIPALNSLSKELRNQGLVVLGVSIDQAEGPVRELVSRLKVGYTNLLDCSKDVYFDSYGLFGQPISIIVDQRGFVREKLIGSVAWTSPQVHQKLEAYLKGR